MHSYLTKLISKRGRTSHAPEMRSLVVHEDFVVAMVTGLLIDALTSWLEHEKPYTPDQMASHCSRMILSILQTMSTWEQNNSALH